MAYTTAKTILADTIEKIKVDGLYKRERISC